MSTFRVQLTTVAHAVPRPVEDDDEGERLVGWVRNAVAAGKAPPAAVVLRPERTEVIGLAPVAQAKVPMARFLAGLCRSTADNVGMPYAMGVIGVFRARRSGNKGEPAVPMAVVFVEWSDNRWWYWRAVVDPETKQVMEDSAVTASAAEGDPLPSVFGRWWALSRRANLSMHLSRNDGADGGSEPPIVH